MLLAQISRLGRQALSQFDRSALLNAHLEAIAEDVFNRQAVLRH